MLNELYVFSKNKVACVLIVSKMLPKCLSYVVGILNLKCKKYICIIQVH